jgi:non-ribosomal peptide synthetase component F
VRWRNNALAEKHEEITTFWRTMLADVPLRVNLPYDRPMPARLSGRGAIHRFELPEATAQLVRKTAENTDATPAAVLTAAFASWLGRTCEQTDLVIALSSSNRTRPEHLHVVGPIGEALLVRVTMHDDDPFEELIRQVSERTFTALDHHLLSLRDVGRSIGIDLTTPQVLFTVVTNPSSALALPGIETTVGTIEVIDTARTELYVVCTPTTQAITMAFEYSTDLFEARTIERWSDGFVVELHRLVQRACHAGP